MNNKIIKKPRLLITASTFPRWSGDKVPLFIYELALSLKNRYEVFVLAPHFKGSKTYEEMDGIKVYRFRYFLPSLEVIAYRGGVINNFKNNKFILLLLPLYVFFGSLYLIYFRLRFGIKLVNVHWFIPFGFVAALLKPIFRFRLVVTSHGGDVFGFSNYRVMNFLLTRVFRFILKKSNQITCVSSDIKNRIIELGKGIKNIDDKVNVAAMGINYDKFSSIDITQRDRNKKVKIVFVGRLAEKKGVKYLIKAINILKEQNIELECEIAGDGPERQSLEGLVAKYGLIDRVKFLGYVDNSKLPEIFSNANILVGPSVIAKKGDREGLPVTYMEAMASALPIVVTANGGTLDLVKNEFNGLVVKERSPEQIAREILRLINDKDLRDKLSKNASETAKNYDWKNISQLFEEIYSKSKKKKKILITTSTFPRWENDKIPDFVFQLAKALLKHYEVHVLAPHYQTARLFEQMEGVRVFRFIYFFPYFEVLTYRSGAVNNLSVNKLYYLLVPFYMVSNLISLIVLLIRYRYSVVNVHWIVPTGFLATILKPFFRFKLITTSHGGDIMGITKKRILRILGINLFIKFIARNSDALIGVNSYIVSELSKLKKDNSNIHRVSVGINTSKFEFKERVHKDFKTQGLNLLFIGRLAPEKNLGLALDLVAELKKENTLVNLTIAGDGVEREKLEKKTKNLGLENEVKFIGYVINKDIKNLLYTHDIFIGTSLREGLPTTYLEALSTGMPIVVSNTFGIDDLVKNEENGLIYEIGNLEEMVKKVKLLVNDFDFYRNISNNALITAQLYDWSNILEKYYEIFEQS